MQFPHHLACAQKVSSAPAQDTFGPMAMGGPIRPLSVSLINRSESPVVTLCRLGEEARVGKSFAISLVAGNVQ